MGWSGEGGGREKTRQAKEEEKQSELNLGKLGRGPWETELGQGPSDGRSQSERGFAGLRSRRGEAAAGAGPGI
jgi:hypothetical protein